MINAILASNDNHRQTDRIEAFQSAGITLLPAGSGEKAYEMLSQTPYDLVITDDQLEDMTGKQFIEKVIARYPFLNCAVISDLAHDLFHELYEGLGVLMQLPSALTENDAQKLYEHINKVAALFEKSSQ